MEVNTQSRELGDMAVGSMKKIQRIQLNYKYEKEFSSFLV